MKKRVGIEGKSNSKIALAKTSSERKHKSDSIDGHKSDSIEETEKTVVGSEEKLKKKKKAHETTTVEEQSVMQNVVLSDVPTVSNDRVLVATSTRSEEIGSLEIAWEKIAFTKNRYWDGRSE